MVKELTGVCEFDGTSIRDEQVYGGWERIGRQARSSQADRAAVTNAPDRQSPSTTTMLKAAVVRQDVPPTAQPPL